MRNPLLIRAAALVLSSLLLASACGSRSSSVRVTSIGTGGFENTGHTCVVTRAGEVECWGDNEEGELGDGTMRSSRHPVVVKGLTKAVAVSAGGNWSCAIVSGGKVRCWGFETLGSDGGPRQTSSPVPIPINGIAKAVKISVSGNGCALISGGTIKCWGGLNSDRLGDGKSEGDWSGRGFFPPVEVVGIHDAIDVSVGYSHSCAVLANGRVKCWGENQYGEIGDGKMWDGNPDNVLTDLSPVFVKGIRNARAVAVGDGDSCALLSDGSIKCWGDNQMGQLGVSNAEMWVALEKMLPHHVSHAAVLRAARTANLHPKAVKGIDATIIRAIRTVTLRPTAVTGIHSAIAISMGDYHACALISGGSIECWGQAGDWIKGFKVVGALGDGKASHGHVSVAGGDPKHGYSYDFSPIPVRAKGISDATAVSAGAVHTCAVLRSGAVECWGGNNYGQLGSSVNGSSLVPSRVRGLK
jgi:hypothetical protein